VINNSRETVTCDAGWTFDLPQSVTGKRQVTVATGDQARVPIHFELPKGLAHGSYEIRLTAKFGTGETQEDHFIIDVLSPLAPIVATLPLTRPSGTLSPLGPPRRGGGGGGGGGGAPTARGRQNRFVRSERRDRKVAGNDRRPRA